MEIKVIQIPSRVYTKEIDRLENDKKRKLFSVHRILDEQEKTAGKMEEIILKYLAFLVGPEALKDTLARVREFKLKDQTPRILLDLNPFVQIFRDGAMHEPTVADYHHIWIYSGLLEEEKGKIVVKLFQNQQVEDGRLTKLWRAFEAAHTDKQKFSAFKKKLNTLKISRRNDGTSLVLHD